MLKREREKENERERERREQLRLSETWAMLEKMLKGEKGQCLLY